MADPSTWLVNNWFLSLQGIGIIGGLLFTAISIRQGAKARRVDAILTLSQQHRDLWGEVRAKPALARITDPHADLIAKPITIEETEFLYLVISHFNTSWLLAQTGSVITKDTLSRDARAFFNLPIPQRIWQQSKEDRDRKFVRFIEGALKD